MRKTILLTVAFLLCGGCQSAGQAVADAQPQAREALVPVTIVSRSARHVYQSELAITPEQQARGLMYRTELSPDHAMLFPFRPARRTAFWMKNTLIPLDIIFIRDNGTIARIAEQATPLSLEPIDSGESVGAVLEIVGGGAAAAGLSVEDRVSWPGGPKPVP